MNRLLYIASIGVIAVAMLLLCYVAYQILLPARSIVQTEYIEATDVVDNTQEMVM